MAIKIFWKNGGENPRRTTLIGLFTALLKISPLAFSDIFHRISGPQVLNSDEARFGGILLFI